MRNGTWLAEQVAAVLVVEVEADVAGVAADSAQSLGPC